jgi:hypothetical protein
MARVAGQHARHRVRLLALRAFVALIVIVVTTAIAGLAFGWRSTAFVIVELVAIAAMYLIDRFGLAVVDRWDRGAEGEEHVGKVLEALAPDGWRVLHDVSLGRGNVDHICIGPGGVFTIETKSHAGRIRVGNINESMLKQAYAQRKMVERITGMPAEALLVFSRAYLDRPVSRQRGVLVLPARMLVGHLARRDSRLGAAEVDRVYAQLLAALPD